jgi:hypothetical protein
MAAAGRPCRVRADRQTQVRPLAAAAVGEPPATVSGTGRSRRRAELLGAAVRFASMRCAAMDGAGQPAAADTESADPFDRIGRGGRVCARSEAIDAATVRSMRAPPADSAYR